MRVRKQHSINCQANFAKPTCKQIATCHHYIGLRLSCKRPWGSTSTDMSLTDWLACVTGEVGELAHIIKEIRRSAPADGWSDEEAMKLATAAYANKFRDELADTVIYLDLLAARAGFDLGAAVKDKFNRDSPRFGWKEYME